MIAPSSGGVSPAPTGRSATVTGFEAGRVAPATGASGRVGAEPLSAADFEQASAATFTGKIAAAGEVQELALSGLLPETTYTIAVRAFDDCHNTGPLAQAVVTTAARTAGEVDACFVATAAYGSVLANDVELLRHVRDSLLRRSVLGELFVETYYTFGPPVAGVVGESELLRATARTLLEPVVGQVRGLRR